MTAAHNKYSWLKLSRQARENWQAQGLPCSRCGQPIDWSLHHNHRMAATADHPVAIVAGGELLPPLSEIAVMHRACNSSRGRTQQRIARLRLVSDSSGPQTQDPPNPENRPPRAWKPPKSPAPPRISTPAPSHVAGTLADTWVPWLGGQGITLRPWQELVLRRALEIDGDGRLVWDRVIVSTPRQSGKSVLLKAYAMARCSHAAHFGEPQEVLHSANNTMAVKRIMVQALRWAADQGLVIRRAAGEEHIKWPDDSLWFLVASKSVWGASGSAALVDESWDLAEEVVSAAIEPTLVERDQSQLWLVSTANAGCTPLMPKARKASQEQPRTLHIEWSAPADADLDDPATWWAASPHWSSRREEMISNSRSTKGWREQWLNMWPDDDGVAPGWPSKFSQCAEPDGGPPEYPVGALEVSQDRSRYGAAVAAAEGGIVSLWHYHADSLKEAVEWLEGREPASVLVGLSLRDEVAGIGAFIQEPAGLAESRQFSPVFANLAENGLLRHNGGILLEESANARTSEVEAGWLLSAKKSVGPVPVLKAAMWAAGAVATGKYDYEEAAIL